MIPYITFNDFIVFLEGIQVPVSQIELSYGQGVSMCKISIVPNKISKEIFPLTRVHIFYKFENKYRLLFDGRIVDVSYYRSPLRTHTILTATDFTEYLSRIPIFFYTLSSESGILPILLGTQAIFCPFGVIDTSVFKLLTEAGTPSVQQIIEEFFRTIFVGAIRKEESGYSTTEKALAEKYPGLYIGVDNDRIMHRFAALSCSYLKELAKQHIWDSLVSNRLGQQEAVNTSIMEFIDEFLKTLGMTWYTNPGLMTPQKGRLANLLMLPFLFAAKVPDCNVIAQMEHCDIIQNKKLQPTRLMYKTMLGVPGTELSEDNQVSYLIYPEIIAKKIAEQSKKESKPFFEYYFSIYTEEEATSGINHIALEMPMDFTSVNSNVCDETRLKVLDSARTYIQNKLAYDYYAYRLQYSNIAISMVFNPFLIPGLPSLIYDAENEFTGRFLPMEITHSLSVNGTTTTIKGAFYQNISEFQKKTKETIVDPIATIVSRVSPDLIDPQGFYKLYQLSYEYTYKGNTLELNLDNLKVLNSIKAWMLYAKNRYIPTIEDFATFLRLTLKEFGQTKKIYYFESNYGYYNKNRRDVIERMMTEILTKKLKLG